MEKEKILSLTTEKLGKTSLSAKTIEAYVYGNLPAPETEPDDAYFAKHVSFLQTLGGQYNHDVSEFTKNYKPEPPKPQETDNKELEELKQQFAEFKNTQERYKKDRVIENLRNSLYDKADGLNISSYKNEWEDAVKSSALSETNTEEEAIAIVKKEFERIVKRYHGDGAKPYGTTKKGPTHSEDEMKKRREAYQKRLQAEGKIPSAE